MSGVGISSKEECHPSLIWRTQVLNLNALLVVGTIVRLPNHCNGQAIFSHSAVCCNWYGDHCNYRVSE